jgi:hypothetical protein
LKVAAGTQFDPQLVELCGQACVSGLTGLDRPYRAPPLRSSC